MSFLTQNFAIRNDLNLNSLRISEDLTLGGNITSDANPNNYTRAEQGFNLAVGYTPVGFDTAPNAMAAFGALTLQPEGPLDTAATVAAALPTTLVLPAGAIITRAFVVAPTALAPDPGPGTYNIGQATDVTTAATNIMTTGTIATINASGVAFGGGLGTAVPNADFGSTGAAATLETTAIFASLGPGSTSAASFVTVRVFGGANTAGSLKVVLEYILNVAGST